MVRYITLASLVAVVLGGCGGGSDSSLGPREVVQQYFAASADGDASKSCGFLAPAARTDVANYAKATDYPGKTDCESMLRALDRVLPEAGRATLRRAHVTSLEVHGDQATATVGGADRPVSLARLDGRWRIAHLDFRYQTFRVRAGQICTRYASTVAALEVPNGTRVSALIYLQGLRDALDTNRREIAALGRPPERQGARDALLAGLAAQQRIAEDAMFRLRSGASVQSTVIDFQGRQLASARPVNAAQATLEIRCG